MKFKKLLPILFTVGMLAGCNPSAGGGSQTGGDTEDGTHTIEIVNKAEMEADWMIGDPTRLLQLRLTDNGEVKSDIGEVLAKNLTITIADSKVVSNNALTFTAMGEGTTTVALKYYGTQKHFNIKVVHRPTNKELYGTTHEGNAADPFNNEDALKIAKAQKQAGSYTTDKYYFAGTVDSFYHAPGSRTDKICSWYMTPAIAGGERFEIYKCTITDEGATSNRQWTEDDIWKGANFVAKGNLADYNGQYETGAAELISVSGTKPEVHTIEATVAQALTAGKALSEGDSTIDTYNITGYVVKKDGNNYFLADTKEVASDDKDMFEVYYYAAPSPEIAGKLLKDAKVKISGIKVKNYKGQIQTTVSPKDADIEVLEAGTEWVAPAGEAVTVTEALAKINAIDITGVTEKTTIYVEDEKIFDVTGIVVSKGTWSSQYNNADFYIADTIDAAKDAQLQVFRFADKAIFDEIAVGDTVKVTCKLAAYVLVTEGVPSIAARETNAGPSAVIVNKGEGGGSGEDVPPAGEAVTVTEALAKINAIDITGVTEKTTIYVEDEKIFDVTGIVVSKGTWSSQYNNADFYIADTIDAAKDAQLQVFRFADKAIFDEIAVGDTVKVTCKLAAYVLVTEGVPSIAARETNAGPSAVIVNKGEGGEGGGSGEDVPPAGTKVSVAITANLFTADATNNKIATYTSGDATFTLDQNKSKTANRLSDTTHLRVYQDAKLAATVTGKTFKTVEITVFEEKYAIAANFTETDATVTVSGTTVRFAFATSVSAFSFVAAAQVRITAVSYYAD